MHKQATAKSTGSGSLSAGDFRMIALTLIDPPLKNTRTTFKKESLAELTQSVKEKGIIQPILVRPVGARFQIVAGERRFRAANQAGLKEIPASVKNLSDEEALDAQLIENLQREDVHPLDEADGFLRLKNGSKLEITDIAQRLAKDARYVARRLSLTNLIEEARQDLRNDLITLAHALEICRLSPEIQTVALAACYERKSVWNAKEQTYIHQPDKEKPARHVKFLQAWIEQNIHLNLTKAPFKLDDARLREDGLTCVECPQRTGFNQTLFHDIKNTDTCLNPLCFQAKIQTLVQVRMAEVETKSGKPAAYISPYYSPNRTKDSIGKSDYHQIDKKVDRCGYAEQAVYAEGDEVGRVTWICRERTCKDHMGRVGSSHSSLAASTINSSRNGDSPEKRNKRKQEIFDIKVDEIVRKRVMKEALQTYGWPLDRAHLNEVAKEFFHRIPSDDQRTICEVFGWSEDLASKLRYDQGIVLRELGKLNDSQLAQFMMLCSFAHYGANQYKHNQVDQKPVVQLSKDRGVNHALIDAKVRVELCAKKYKAAHETYLDAVTNGETAKKPVVYEQPQNVKAEAARKASAKSSTTAKSDKRKTGANTARG
ncbi:MAG TPA: ParB/RepB/Spo0J family partition protein [Blastocatellia bacterium]|nr:ParB/RepB/Spo0J family partition protein [Blastocatellia bacterium]